MSRSNVDNGTLRFLLTGGGTGGHLFPAIATAEKMTALLPGSRILFIGTRRRLDRDSLNRYGFTVKTIHSYGFKGKNPLELAKALLVMPLSLLESGYHILRFRPDVVMGVGGYVTGPVVAAAWMLGRPTLIHEQNSVPGLANRMLGRLVRKICLSLPQSGGYFPAEKSVLTGNPVRAAIIDGGSARRKEHGKKTVLVLGGSQGARTVNRLMIEAISGSPGDFSSIRIIHQTGKDDEQMVRAAYEDIGIDHQVSAFFTDMGGVYSQADLVVSRAGATTLAEIGVVGLPAVLIPYPFAADNHQQKNASWYAESGAAVVFEEKRVNGARLAREILLIMKDEERLARMSASMKKLGIADAAERIVSLCLDLSKKNQHAS